MDTNRKKTLLLLINIESNQVAVIQPEIIQQYFSVTETSQKEIIETRNEICDIVEIFKNNNTQDTKAKTPLLIITGPEYIGDEKQAVLCSKWLNYLNSSNKINQGKNVKIAMRTNLYKICYPSHNDTKIKGDAFSDSFKKLKSRQSFLVSNGLTKSRDLLVKIVNNHVPIVGQITDNITPQYFSDLYSISFLSASLLESQIHRELVSGMSYPIGLQTSLNEKNDFTNCQIKKNLLKDTILACSNKHRFLSVTKQGHIAVVETTGNNDSFIVLKINNIIDLDEKRFQEILNNLIDETLSTPILFELGAIDNSVMFESTKTLINYLLTNNVDNKIQILGFVIDSGTHYNSNLENDEVEKINLNNNKDYQQISTFVNKMLSRRAKEKLRYSRNCDPSLLNFKKIFKNFDYLEMQKIMKLETTNQAKESSEEESDFDDDNKEFTDENQKQKTNIIQANNKLFNTSNNNKSSQIKDRKLFKKFFQTYRENAHPQNDIKNQEDKNVQQKSDSSYDNCDGTEKANLEFFKRILGAEQFDKLFGHFDISQKDDEFSLVDKDNEFGRHTEPKESLSMPLPETTKIISGSTQFIDVGSAEVNQNHNKDSRKSKSNASNPLNKMIYELRLEKDKGFHKQDSNKSDENTKINISFENELHKNQIFANELIKYINSLQEKLK